MLDLNTALFFLMVLTAMDGIIALLIWNAHRHMKGLAITAGGFLAFGIAVWMVPLTDIWLVTVRNTAFNLSQAMAAEGMAAFLEKPRLRWLPASVTAFSVLFWPLAQWLIPPDLSPQIRTIVSSLLSIAIMARIAWLMARDRTQTRLLRSVTLTCLCAIFVTLGSRLYDAATGPWSDAIFYSNQQAWFYFLICVEGNFLFFCMLTMVGERLSRDLRERNRELSREIEFRSRLQRDVSDALAVHLEQREERRRFLHILGHEIGTPLAVIDRAAEMLQLAPQTLDKRLEAIRTAVRRLSRLTSGLLAVERACLGAPLMEELDAETLVREAVETLEEGGTAPVVAASAAIRFSGDRDLIVMALVNVMNNARKFSPADQPITVSVAQDGAEVTISVSDRGIGFPEEDLKTLGQCFFRGANAGSVPGSGLGVYIVSLIMDRHGGRIVAANREGGGATVTLFFPGTGG
jgi:signal transduction histidine kinase